MKNKFTRLFVTVLVSLFIGNTSAKEYFLATDGSDSNPGTFEQPYATLSKAISMLQAGDICYVRGGTYYQTSRIFVRQTGTKDARISLFAYENEKPVFDWSNAPQTCESDGRGIEHSIGANYWHYKGLEICYAGDNGMKMEGSFCVIEQCVFHHNRDTGLQLGFGKDSKGNNTRNPDFIYGRYNIILNCDSYDNYDIKPTETSGGGGDADGFAIKLFPGPGNEFHGCRSWHNSDDGWDFYHVTFPIVVHNCWTMNNGYDKGNGNGFKMGGFTGDPSYGAHIFTNCVSTDNPKKGFDQNNHTEGCYMFNCISARNGANYQFDSTKGGDLKGKWVLRNCVGSQAVDRNHKFLDDANTYDIQFCSWNIFDGNNTGSDSNKRIKTDYSAEFNSLKYEDALSPRQENGELPLTFARLVDGSRFIDKGTPITDFVCENYSESKYNSSTTVAFNGTTADLGAFEYGTANNEFILVMPENDGSVPEEIPELTEWEDGNGNYYSEKILLDWYSFQETVLPTMISCSGGAVEPAYVNYDSSTLNSEGCLHLSQKGSSYMQLELPSLRDLQIKTYATGSRKVTINYKKEGETIWTESKTFDLSKGSSSISLMSDAIKTKQPISIQVVNSRTDGGSLRISDLFVSGYQQVDENGDPVGIETTEAGNVFDIYQTATSLIVYGEIASLQIVSINGKIVAGSQNMQVINTSGLSKGVYLIVITDKNGKKSTQKFVK